MTLVEMLEKSLDLLIESTNHIPEDIDHNFRIHSEINIAIDKTNNALNLIQIQKE